MSASTRTRRGRAGPNARAHGVDTPGDLLRTQKIVECAEHTDGRIERLSEAKGVHAGANESRWLPDRYRFLPREREHLPRLIDAHDLVAAAGEWQGVISRAASEIQNRLGLSPKTPEDPLEKLHISLVVDQLVLVLFVLLCEPTTEGRPNGPQHPRREPVPVG